MLSRMLSKKTKKYNSPEKFADYLSDLYDSKISVECYGSGEILSIMFRVIFLNRKFCEGLDIELSDFFEDSLFQDVQFEDE